MKHMEQLQLDLVTRENIARFQRKLKTTASKTDRKALQALITRERKVLADAGGKT